MELFTVRALGSGNFIKADRGWLFSSPSRSIPVAKFNVQDSNDRPRFFNIQSLQPIGDGIVYDGFYRKQLAALVMDERPKNNEDYVLVALVVEGGYIHIPDHCYQMGMVKSPFIEEGDMTFVVIYLHKHQYISFNIRRGNRITSNLMMKYNFDHQSVEVYDYAKEVIISTPVDSKLQNPIIRFFRFLKFCTSRPDPRTVR